MHVHAMCTSPILKQSLPRYEVHVAIQILSSGVIYHKQQLYFKVTIIYGCTIQF